MGLSPEVAEHPAVKKIQSVFPDALVNAERNFAELTLEVRSGAIHSVLELLRDADELRYSLLSDLTAVDRFPEEPRFEIVYQLLSIENRKQLRLKVRVTGDDPVIESVVSLWPGANMPEREVFDLFGVQFKGHPNLSRLMMPDDWEGHPLRKDYPVEGPR